MNTVVLKFGGTSVGSIEKIKHVAEIVKFYKEQYGAVAVVVSAMAGTTNNLVALMQGFDINTPIANAARDVILSTGEQITTGLLTLALAEQNIEGTALQGWQVPIFTTPDHTEAEITDIQIGALARLFRENKVVIIPGFQGIDANHNITTLGRGGSDTTAVALAGFLGAADCHIYTDVNGVYTGDPRYIENVLHHENVSLEHMEIYAKMGAKVMHPASIKWAIQKNVDVTIRSTQLFNEGYNVQDQTVLTSQSELPCIGVTHISDCYFNTAHCDFDINVKFDSESIQTSNQQKSFVSFQQCDGVNQQIPVSLISIVGNEHDLRSLSLQKTLPKGLKFYYGKGRLSLCVPRDYTRSALNLVHDHLYSNLIYKQKNKQNAS